MATPISTDDLKWVTNRIKQQNKTQKERQHTIPRTRQCTGCKSTEKPKLAYQVIACQECATFMRETLNNGLNDIECNNKGAKPKQLTDPTLHCLTAPKHTTGQFIHKQHREHCKRHRFIQLLAKGFSTPTIENIAIVGQNHLHREMKKALYIGAIKIAGEKYGFHEHQNSSSINSITEELNLTEDCCDLKQMIGSLAQPQEEPPTTTNSFMEPQNRTLQGQEPWPIAKSQEPWPRATAIAKSHGQGPPRTQSPHPTTTTNDKRLKYHGVTPTGRKPYTIHNIMGKIVDGKIVAEKIIPSLHADCPVPASRKGPGYKQ